MAEANETNGSRSSRALFGAGVLVTILWLGIIAFYAIDRWPALYAMKMNELGDFLAGAFAPLAFFWLVIAVILQQKELANSREVLALQAKELAASVDAIRDQTSNFSEVEDKRAVARHHQDFNERIRILAVGLAAISQEVAVRSTIGSGGTFRTTKLFIHSDNLTKLSAADQFEEVMLAASKSVESILPTVTDLVESTDTITINFYGQSAFATWFAALDETLKWSDETNNRLVHLMRGTLKLDELHTNLEKLNKCVLESQKLQPVPKA